MAYSGKYTPKNPSKYYGDPTKITYRSLWERKCMLIFDDNPNILKWGSEEIAIPYMSPVDRKEIYSRDITYGTNNEFGFDYLRDNMASHPNNQVQNGHVYAIVDEVDSVLIDEARTPLIISGSVDAPMNTYYQELKPSVFSLIQKQTSLINEFIAEAEKKLATDKNEAGKKLLLAQRGMPKNKRLLKVYQQQGIQQLVHNVESEFIRDKKMTELDEKLFFTVDERSNIIDLTEMGRSILSPSNPEDFVLPDIGELFHEIENNKKLSKEIARRNYRDRQIDKWWKWSWEARGKVKYKELVSYQDKYKLKVYG